MFWIRNDQLDAEQRHAVEGIPETASFLLRGPAGSGKTNILLLRAKWLTLKKKSDFKIVVFTQTLRAFIAAGCEQYGINPDSVLTQMSFFRSILEEYGVPFELTRDFETDRSMLAGKVMSLIDSGRLSSSYCSTLLIDEAQDYTDTELLVFRKLTQNLILAADSRQSIYRSTHTVSLPEKLVDGNVVTLLFHYRSGLRLCKVADAILANSAEFPPLQGECRYSEATQPSSVKPVVCGSFGEQVRKIIENLTPQLDLYPREPLGVLFPKREQVEEFKAAWASAGVKDFFAAVNIATLHAAKGWEFRAVHLGACETLPRMGSTQKRLAYTGVLRGKTSAHIYYTGHLPGYLENALAVLDPPRPDPSMDQLFGGA